MGLSYRLLLVDQSDRICRLSVAKFDEMARNPRAHRYPQFASQRVRAAGAVIHLADRKPLRVVRITFDILTFDQVGCFDHKTFEHQQFSRVFEGTKPPVLRAVATGDEPGVVDASSLFAARGGRWAPSRTLAHAMHEAALGRIACPQL